MSRHRFDPFSFLFGAAFFIISLGSLSGTRLGAFHPEAFWSLGVVGTGIALVVWAIIAIARRDRAAAMTEPSLDEPSGAVPTMASGGDEPTDEDASDERPTL